MCFTKYLKLLILLFFTFVLNISNANQFNGSVNLENVELGKTQVNGSAEFKNSKFQSLEVNGTLDFQDLIIAESVKVNGTIKGKHIQCRYLIVSGDLEGNSIHVKGDTRISGYFNVSNSSFEDLEISSKKIVLNNTTTKNIVIKASKNNAKQQIILNGTTIVNGNIIFESGFGEVVLDKKAKIQGQVSGGETKYMN